MTRKQKLLTITMDDDTKAKLDELATENEDVPGNISLTVRKLVRIAWDHLKQEKHENAI